MPDRPSWLPNLSQILDQLSTEAVWTRRDVEGLLDVKARQAQSILLAAGAKRQGKSWVIDSPALALFLRTVAGPTWEREEKERRRKWALKMTEARAQYLAQPPLLVEVPLAEKRTIDRRGVDALPPEIQLGPGYLTIRFQDVDESLVHLFRLAAAIAADRDGYARQVSIPKFGGGSRSTAEATPSPKSEQKGLFEKEKAAS